MWHGLQDAILINAVDMALFTGHAGMFALQFEGRQVVIKFGWFPAFGGVAGGAIGAKTTLMRVFSAVTGETVLGRGLQRRQGMRLLVAGSALGLGVLPGQFKRNPAMVEVRTEGFFPVVAVQAFQAKVEGVLLGEIGLHGKMTVDASGHLKRPGETRLMAILAHKRGGIGFPAVGAQGEVQIVVWEVRRLHFQQGGVRAAVIGMAGVTL